MPVEAEELRWVQKMVAFSWVETDKDEGVGWDGEAMRAGLGAVLPSAELRNTGFPPG